MRSDDVSRVLILGTDHLIEWDGIDGRPDILTRSRQDELVDVAARLERFSPNKVAVEVLASRQEALDAAYRSYLAGDRHDDRNEVTQIGFRLAQAAGATVHAIDADWTLSHEPVEHYFQRHPDEQFAETLSSTARELVNEGSRLRDILPLAEFLSHVNETPSRLLNDREYLDRWLTIGARDNWAGVELVASWYRRNLRVFANLLLIAGTGDRIVVVFGLGHIPSLRHFAETSGRFEYVDPVALLAPR